MKNIKDEISNINKQIENILASDNVDYIELHYLKMKRKDLQENPLFFEQNTPVITDGNISLYLKEDNKIPYCESHYIIFDTFINEPVGYVLYLGKDDFFCGGNISYFIEPKHRGNNYTFKALQLLCQKLHTDGIKEIYISAYKDNIALIKIAKKLNGIELPYHDNDDIAVYKCSTQLYKKTR